MSYGATTYVFWDFRDCPIPDGLDAFELSLNITRVLRNMGYYGWITFRAYGDIFSLDYSEGFELFHVPAGKSTRKKIAVDILARTLHCRREPLNVMPILGDISGDMWVMKSLAFVKSKAYYNVLLSQPEEASGKLLDDSVSTELVWEKLSAGLCTEPIVTNAS